MSLSSTQISQESISKYVYFVCLYVLLCIYTSMRSYRLVCERWQNDGLLHGVHHQLPQLLQHTFQHSLFTDLSKQSQAGRRRERHK